MGKYFGTDGIRGKAGDVLTADLAYRTGRAVGHVFQNENPGKRLKVLIGKDGRISGDMLEAALTAGLTSVGIDVVSLGMCPTPAVAWLTQHTDAIGGAVISASHNPFADNGIKFFNTQGHKLTDDEEAEIEQLIDDGTPIVSAVDEMIGRSYTDRSVIEAYIEHILEIADGDTYSYRVVMDCANGASSEIAPLIFEKLGLDITLFFHEPTGTNINADCGSTKPQALQKAVLNHQADFGIAFDGDADRFLAVDHEGKVVDGDALLAIFALLLQKENRLADNTLVVTVMSNLGLHNVMKANNISVRSTQVGDRYVNECMRDNGLVLGGEQSGHIIFSEYNTTGDGIISALMLLKALSQSKQTLTQMAQVMSKVPQVLINVNVQSKQWQDNPAIIEVIKAAEEQLGETGRVLVRASGTENLLRVMVEGEEESQTKGLARNIADVIAHELGH